MFSSLVLVLLIAAIAWILTGAGLAPIFGVVLPYAAVLVFIIGMIWRMVYWAKSPVPFCIPTTGGQEQSLSFIKQNKIDCPSTTWGVIKRMFVEVFLFRSLFRNTSAEIYEESSVTNDKGEPSRPVKAWGANLHDSVNSLDPGDWGWHGLKKEAEMADNDHQNGIVENQRKAPKPFGGIIN